MEGGGEADRLARKQYETVAKFAMEILRAEKKLKVKEENEDNLIL